MAASGEAPGGVGGWGARWRAADGVVGLMGAVGQPFARSQNSEVFVMKLPPHASRAAVILQWRPRYSEQIIPPAPTPSAR